MNLAKGSPIPKQGTQMSKHTMVDTKGEYPKVNREHTNALKTIASFEKQKILKGVTE